MVLIDWKRLRSDAEYLPVRHLTASSKAYWKKIWTSALMIHPSYLSSVTRISGVHRSTSSQCAEQIFICQLFKSNYHNHEKRFIGDFT